LNQSQTLPTIEENIGKAVKPLILREMAEDPSETSFRKPRLIDPQEEKKVRSVRKG
jgi:hypothetical protein